MSFICRFYFWKLFKRIIGVQYINKHNEVSPVGFTLVLRLRIQLVGIQCYRGRK